MSAHLTYAQEITLPETALDELVKLTEGVTGAFIKELMRQATLRAAIAGRAPGLVSVSSRWHPLR